MKNKTTFTWTLAAVIYLILVIAGYFLIDARVGVPDPHQQHSGQNSDQSQKWGLTTVNE